jgi:WD40 repeat protein
VGEPLVGHDDWVTAAAVGKLGGRPVAVSGGNDEMVRVWDLEAGGPLGGPLVGHGDWVTAVALGEAP